MRPDAKILFLGDAKEGKSAIFRALMGQDFTKEYVPTIGADYKEKVYDNFRIGFWDCGDSASSIGGYKGQIHDADLICIVWNRATYDPELNQYQYLTGDWEFSIKRWLNFICENSFPKDKPLIFIHGKSDTSPSSIVYPEIVSPGQKQAISELADEFKNHHFITVSAKTSKGINDLENLMLKLLLPTQVMQTVIGKEIERPNSTSANIKPKEKEQAVSEISAEFSNEPFPLSQQMGPVSMNEAIEGASVKFKRTLKLLKDKQINFLPEKEFVWGGMILFSSPNRSSSEAQLLETRLAANALNMSFEENEYTNAKKRDFENFLHSTEEFFNPDHSCFSPFSAAKAYEQHLKSRVNDNPFPVLRSSEEKKQDMILVEKLLHLIVKRENRAGGFFEFFCCGCSPSPEKREAEINLIYDLAYAIYESLWTYERNELESGTDLGEEEAQKLQRQKPYRPITSAVIKNILEKHPKIKIPLDAEKVLRRRFPELNSGLIVDARRW